MGWLPWDLVQTPRGLCNNNSFINKHDVMIKSSDFFLMSFFNLLTKELWQILEIFIFILGANYPNNPFFSEIFAKFSISQNKITVSISSTYVIYTYLPHTTKKFSLGLGWHGSLQKYLALTRTGLV